MFVIYNKKKYNVRKQKDGRSSLTISNKKISEITKVQGLEQLQNLSVLNLDNNQISEIKGLENLINLEIKEPISRRSAGIKLIFEKIPKLCNLQKFGVETLLKVP